MSDEPNFLYGSVLRLLWGDNAEDAGAVITAVLTKGTIFATFESEAWLLAWPDSRFGIIAFVLAGRGGQNNEYLVSWPIHSGGVVQDITITAVHEDTDCGLIRMIECGVNGVGLTLFDSGCVTARLGLAAGDRAVASISGWALELGPGRTEPIVLKPDAVSDSILEAFRDTFARDGQLVLHTKGMTSVLPAWTVASPVHSIDGIVRASRPGPVFADRNYTILTVTISRDPDDRDLDIDLVVSDRIWPGASPRAGDTVQGLVWLQATIATPPPILLDP